MGFYSAMKNEFVIFRKKMEKKEELEIIFKNISQVLKDKYFMFSLVCNLGRYRT